MDLILPKQAAEFLCVSEMTLRKWRWEGKGPQFAKMGRKVVYRECDLRDFISSKLRLSTSDMEEASQ